MLGNAFYLHKIPGNTLLNTVGRFIYTKYWEIIYVEHWWKINKSSHSVQYKVFSSILRKKIFPQCST
jgi:hypothetical protein